jgi:hypothetical protein
LGAPVSRSYMAELATTLRLVGAAVGVLGATLLFLEFFQFPSYIDYNSDMGSYSIEFSPDDPREYTWVGRVGALCLAIAFAIQFLATFLG